MIVITGATGKLGRQVVEQLLKKVASDRIALAIRNPEKATQFASQGVQVRQADYSKPDTWNRALEGATHVLLISSNEIGQRSKQHNVVVQAAAKAGIELLAYTSILHASSSKMALAGEHRETEVAIAASKVPYVFLRNGWYTENYTDNLEGILAHNAVLGSAGDGRIAAASRADYAAAAVTVLTQKGHAHKTYELAGDVPFTMSDMAAEIAKQSGKPVVYKNMAPSAYKEALIGMGLPALLADILADSDDWASRGALEDKSGDLHRLIGRATTPLPTSIQVALRK